MRSVDLRDSRGRAQRGDRFVCTRRDHELTYERHANDEPHGDEAKPCGHAGVSSKVHVMGEDACVAKSSTGEPDNASGSRAALF